MEQGPTFRISVPKYPTKDPNHRILAPQRSRFTHYYFYIYDEVLGPIVIRVASFLPFQATYYLNGHSKGLQNLNVVRTKFLAITDRFAGLQAQWLNVHVDFPLLQRMALPIVTGSVYYAGIKIHETRIIRLLEVFLHAGNNLGGWSAKHIHQVILQSFQFPKSPMVSTNFATTCASLKVTVCSNVTAHDMPTA